MRVHLVALILSAFAVSAACAQAPTTTTVNVHVIARDAKLIGTSVGGARVLIRDVATGDILAEGVHLGGTGDTRLIMQTPVARGDERFNTPGAARWTAELDLAGPTLVEIRAEGPLNYPQARVTASMQTLLIPGQTVGGDGFVLELPGYIVEHVGETSVAGPNVTVTARVRMQCSCPTGPDQLWSAGTVTARLLQGDGQVQQATLAYAGNASHFSGTFSGVAAGDYTLELVASDPEKGNFGVWRGEMVVR